MATLSAREMEQLGLAMLSLKSAPEVDHEKFAQLAGLTLGSAKVIWGKIWKKIKDGAAANPGATGSKTAAKPTTKPAAGKIVKETFKVSKAAKSDKEAAARTGKTAKTGGKRPAYDAFGEVDEEDSLLAGIDEAPARAEPEKKKIKVEPGTEEEATEVPAPDLSAILVKPEETHVGFGAPDAEEGA